jgi:hypothetical protein
MFGYVLPLVGRLEEADKKLYKAVYCGLCKNLRHGYGFRSGFLVNYDMTFLYCLLAKGQESIETCSCPARPFCRKDCVSCDAVMDYVTDLTILLSWWKLRDGVEDGRGVKKLLSTLGLWLYNKPYKKAAQRREQENEAFRKQLKELGELEQGKCSGIDPVADTFASLLCACTGELPTPGEKRILEQILYHVGRYLYLVDALEDLPKDVKQGNYNPLQYRYGVQEGRLSPENEQALADTIEASISLAASALELLPAHGKRKILENIIYDGLPTVLKSVRKGSFRKRRSKK